jgi:hypothetical protein
VKVARELDYFWCVQSEGAMLNLNKVSALFVVKVARELDYFWCVQSEGAMLNLNKVERSLRGEGCSGT